MNNKWRSVLTAIKKTVDKTEIHCRDPYTVSVVTANIHNINTTLANKVVTGVGISKRTRYAKKCDKPDAMMGKQIARDRAYKDVYEQFIEYRPEMEAYVDQPF